MFYICSMTENSNPSAEATLPKPPARRQRSVAARRTARRNRAEREARIVSLLNRGVAIAEIAAREGLSPKRMRNLVREILARRMPQPPAEFLALQVSRLNEALLVSYSAMQNCESGANFEAVDRVVKIVRELDRYHGFAPRGEPTRAPEILRLAAPSQTPLALEGSIPSDSEIAPQAIENA
jgi:DNA-binding CsgD family transcriptional regulator